ncbi:hypothetical protein CEP51_001876 [Fusarium floridanum]|uniref:Protein kinase domain-containing protein n=1 Tax=Fusarium floridanum TaxID=1325733 RepID=A0A428SEE7_9HYPO|nr:hypothetical protein CEP51_001876 [Fusarium floridanum]
MSSLGVWDSEDVEQSRVRNRDFPGGPYIRGTLLGQGGFACVYKVLRQRDRGVFAGKTSPNAVTNLRREASVLRNLNHEHIVKYIDYYEDADYPSANVLVLELCPHGNLQTLINDYTYGVPQKKTLEVMLQLSRALRYLHGQGRYHGDFKPRNVLVRSWDPVNVAMADCADVKRVININSRDKPHGTKSYWSPYVFRHNRHAGTSDDIWALGVSLLAMMSQSPRFVKKEERMYPRQCHTHAQNLAELNPTHEIVGLANRMLEWNPKARVTADDLVEVIPDMLSKVEREEYETGMAKRMELKIPEGFEPIVFW